MIQFRQNLIPRDWTVEVDFYLELKHFFSRPPQKFQFFDILEIFHKYRKF